MTVEFTGVAKCSSEYELDNVVKVLGGIPEVAISADELSVTVFYSSKERVDVDKTISRLSSILESVEQHGISIISEGGDKQ